MSLAETRDQPFEAPLRLGPVHIVVTDSVLIEGRKGAAADLVVRGEVFDVGAQRFEYSRLDLVEGRDSGAVTVADAAEALEETVETVECFTPRIVLEKLDDGRKNRLLDLERVLERDRIEHGIKLEMLLAHGEELVGVPVGIELVAEEEKSRIGQTNIETSASEAYSRKVAAPHTSTPSINSSFFTPIRSIVIWQPSRWMPPSRPTSTSSGT